MENHPSTLSCRTANAGASAVLRSVWPVFPSSPVMGMPELSARASSAGTLVRLGVKLTWAAPSLQARYRYFIAGLMRSSLRCRPASKAATVRCTSETSACRSVEPRFTMISRSSLLAALKSFTLRVRISSSSRWLAAGTTWLASAVPRNFGETTPGHGLIARSSGSTFRSSSAGTMRSRSAASKMFVSRRSQPPNTRLSSGAQPRVWGNPVSVTIPMRGASPRFIRATPAITVLATAPPAPTKQTPNRLMHAPRVTRSMWHILRGCPA